MSDDRKPLPETGFRCYAAKPEKITCNMTILVDDMISWLQNEKASRQNIKQNKQGKDTIYLTMLETVKQDAKTSHFFAYDDFEPSKQGDGYQKPSNNVTPMSPVANLDDIPF
jgi:hypothetical protein